MPTAGNAIFFAVILWTSFNMRVMLLLQKIADLNYYNDGYCSKPRMFVSMLSGMMNSSNLIFGKKFHHKFCIARTNDTCYHPNRRRTARTVKGIGA
jgi:hypothetical protein